MAAAKVSESISGRLFRGGRPCVARGAELDVAIVHVAFKMEGEQIWITLDHTRNRIK
jgi:hypothetical protein